MCSLFKQSKTSIGLVVSKSGNVNGLDTVFEVRDRLLLDKNLTATIRNKVVSNDDLK